MNKKSYKSCSSLVKMSLGVFLSGYFASSVVFSEVAVLNRGTVSCTPRGFNSVEAKTCELSSSVKVGNYLILGDDKRASELLVYDIKELEQRPYQRKVKPVFLLPLDKRHQIKKVESSTRYKDWILVFSAFDRTTEVRYTRGIAFKVDFANAKPSQIHTIGEMDLYKKLQDVLYHDVLKPINYFKIEAATVVPHPDKNKPNEHLLLLGIRCAGLTYKDPDLKFLIKVIALPISEENGKIHIGDPIPKVVYSNLSIENYGISAMDYVKEDNALYMLITFEHKEEMKGKMLKLALSDLLIQKDPEVIAEHPFDNHKPEELTLIDKHKFFVVADEDRQRTLLPDGSLRELSEAPFWIIDIKPSHK